MAHERLYELDGLRGIAALSVFIFHLSLFRFGSLGVDLFFIISGFVIFLTLQNVKDLKTFWISRLLRLYPSYWLSLILAILFTKIFSSDSFHFNDLIGNITMLQPIFRAKYFSGVYWTLYVEMLFYLTMSLLFLFNALKNIETLIFIGLTIIIAINSLYLVYFNNENFTRFYVLTRSLFPLISHFQYFSAGILAFFVQQKGLNFKRGILLLLTLLSTAIIHPNSVMINSFMTITEHVFGDLIIYTVFVLAIRQKFKYFRHRILIWLGIISYPLYLIHSLIIKLKEYYLPNSSICYIVITIIVTLAASSLLTYFYDIPIRTWLKNKLTLIKAF